MESFTDPKPAAATPRPQAVVYVQLSMLVLLVHDWLTLLDREVEHVWRSEWSIPKVLFLISRYGIFLDMSIMVALHTAPYGKINHDTCLTLYKIAGWNNYIGIITSECILLLRTIAIYSRSRLVAVPLSIGYMIGAVAGIILTWHDLHTTFTFQPPSVSFIGCYYVQGGAITPPPRFLMLLIFELVIVILTIRSALSGLYIGTPLLKVLYRDSVAFSLMLSAVTLSTILVQILGPHQLRTPASLPFRVAHSIVCCRIILNLRRAALPKGAPSWTSLSFASAAAPGEQTNEAETIRLEMYGGQSDRREPDSRRQADQNYSS